MNTWYLVLIMVVNGGITSQQIPQVNKTQCEINAKAYNGKLANNQYRGVYTKSICVVGAKQ